jgi:hypothetical protein
MIATPEMVLVGNTVVNVFKITELNIYERIVEICPACGGTLYKGYCSKCNINFSSIGDDERSFINLLVINGYYKMDSYSDRKLIIDLATLGLKDLRGISPGTSKKFDELKITNSLPKVRILKSTPSTMADPFYRSNGNNKTF